MECHAGSLVTISSTKRVNYRFYPYPLTMYFPYLCFPMAEALPSASHLCWGCGLRAAGREHFVANSIGGQRHPGDFVSLWKQHGPCMDNRTFWRLRVPSGKDQRKERRRRKVSPTEGSKDESEGKGRHLRPKGQAFGNSQIEWLGQHAPLCVIVL